MADDHNKTTLNYIQTRKSYRSDIDTFLINNSLLVCQNKDLIFCMSLCRSFLFHNWLFYFIFIYIYSQFWHPKQKLPFVSYSIDIFVCYFFTFLLFVNSWFVILFVNCFTVHIFLKVLKRRSHCDHLPPSYAEIHMIFTVVILTLFYTIH